MTKALSLYLPTWPTDRLRRIQRQSPDRSSARPPDATALLLVTRQAGCERVVHRDAIAAAAGVHPGITVAHARSLLASQPVQVLPSQPQQDAAALQKLARWATRFTPQVTTDPPDGLLLDLAGCERLWGSNRAMLDLVADSTARLGFTARAALSSNFAAAWAFARYGSRERMIVPPARLQQAVADLPTAALRIDLATIDALALMSIERVGHLLQLPRKELASRFGPELIRRLDQLLGQALETIEPVRTQLPPSVERLFAGPTTQWEALEITSRQLIEQLCIELHGRESGACRLELLLHRSDAGPLTLAVTLSRPSRDPRHLMALLLPRLEKANLGFGVERIVVTAADVGRLPHLQSECWSNPQPATSGDVGQMLDVLSNRLGTQRLTQIEPIESHLPERVLQRRSAVMQTRGHQEQQVTCDDRPSLLLEKPAPIEVISLQPEGPPVQLRREGQVYRIEASFGPERISPAWWQTDRGSTRDYFKVQDQTGRWLWIYRELETGLWFLHGQWA